MKIDAEVMASDLIADYLDGDSEATKRLEKMCQNEEKFRWHDLRKRPENVPQDEHKVICATKTKSGRINYVLGYYDGSRWCCGMNSNVVAWMDVEPFCEEDDER